MDNKGSDDPRRVVRDDYARKALDASDRFTRTMAEMQALRQQIEIWETIVKALDADIAAEESPLPAPESLIPADGDAGQPASVQPRDAQPVRYPRGNEAVRIVLRERGPSTAREIAADLIERGWPPKSKSPRDAVSTSLQRLKSLGEVIALDGSVYALVGSAPTSEAPDDLFREREAGNP